MVVLPAAPLFIEKLLLHLSFYSQKHEVLWSVIEFFKTGSDCNSLTFLYFVIECMCIIV